MRIDKMSTGKLVVTVAALLTAVCVSGCTNERKENELAYRQIGINCMESGDYAGAVAAFEQALSNCPGTIGETERDICFYKAAAQYASGDGNGALETYDALIAYDAKDADAYYTRGCLHLQRGEGELAFADFSNAIAYNADDYELYIHIYENLAAYHLNEQGEEYIKKAFEIGGDAAENLAYRGELYLLLGEYENAVTELNAALEKGSVEANRVLAQVFKAQGDAATAETYYKAYVDAGAADARTMNALAEIAMEKLDYAAALNYINQGLAMEQVTNKRALLQNQIICMEYTADFAGAWQVVQEYVMLYPNDTDMQREYIFLKNRQNSVDENMQIQAEIEIPDAAGEQDALEDATEDASEE